MQWSIFFKIFSFMGRIIKIVNFGVRLRDVSKRGVPISEHYFGLCDLRIDCVTTGLCVLTPIVWVSCGVDNVFPVSPHSF